MTLAFFQELFGIPATIIVAVVVGLLGSSGAIGLFLFFRSESRRRLAEADKAEADADKVELENEAEKVSLSFKWTHELENVKDLLQKTIDKKDAKISEVLSLSLQKDKAIETLEKAKEQIGRDLSLKTNELRQHILQYRRLFTKLRLAYWETDKDENLVFVTSAWCDLFGISITEAKKNDWRNYVNTEDLSSLDEVTSKIKLDMSDDIQPVFTIENPRTSESYEVTAVYVAMFDERGNLIKSFGVTMKTNERSGN